MGNLKQARVTYRQRLAKGQTSTTDDCDNDGIPAYTETTVDLNGYRKYSFIIPTTELEKYCEESVMLAAGQQASGMLREHAMRIAEIINGLVGDVGDDLLGLVTWGKNAKTGSNAAGTINLNKNADTLDMTDGIAKLLTEVRFNEISGLPIIVGAGLFDAFEQLKANSILGLNSAGVNMANFARYKYYYDLYASPKWTNDNSDYDQIGVFANGTIGFVDFNNFVGFKSGRLGTSYFTQLPLPVDNSINGAPPAINFDVQVKFLDCPTEVGDGYGGTTTVNRAWQIIISKKFGLWQMPSDAYGTTDRLTGVNGALRYNVTNTCESC
jgi:hypothetical protein